MTSSTSNRPRHIGIFLFDGVDELDVAGPWEVLAHWVTDNPGDGYTVSCFSLDGRPVTASKGLGLGPHHSLADAPPLAVLVHPGGIGTRRLMKDPVHLDWVRAQHSEAQLVASVCSGALVLAGAGLLHNRPATTHWSVLKLLSDIDPSIELRPDARYVDDGDVVTSAGISAGIDMALHLVARFAGDERAGQVRRSLQYDPQPPV